MKKNDVRYTVFAALCAGYLSGIAAVRFSLCDVRMLAAAATEQRTVCQALVSNTLVVAAVAFLGYSLIGFVFILPVIYLKMLYTGAVVTALWASYGFEGGLTAIVRIFPPAAVMAAVLYYLGYESLRFSLDSVCDEDININMKYHTLLSIAMMAVSLLCALWEIYAGRFFK